jgi:hypothetical protein
VSDPKPFASLSSGLLARKGAARPAMRPQGFSSPNSGLEDLGWNDMGHESGHDHAGLTPLAPLASHNAQDSEDNDQVVEHPRGAPGLGLSPVASPVHSQQAELAERLADGDEDFDEDFDETAEPYEPESGSAGFNGFDLSDEDESEAPEPEFRVQFKGGKKPLDLGPSPEAEAEPDMAREEDVLDLVEAVAPVPATPELVLSEPVLTTYRAPSAKAKAAFTLRLDPERHLKLRLACAVRGGSAQQLVTDALDRLLQGMPELEELTDKVRQRN